MADSAEYQVLLALKAALESITIANGYHQDIATVDLYEYFPDDEFNFPAIMLATIDSAEDQTRFANKNEVTLRVVALVRIEDYETEHQAVGEIVGDIKDRLFSELPTFLGGMSRWVRIDSVERVHGDEENARAGANVVLSILFRHPIDDAFTVSP